MQKYAAKRILYIFFVFFIISIMMFLLFKATPGDPVMQQLEGQQQRLTPTRFKELYDQTYVRLGLDKPLPVQYLRWMGRTLTGDFGRSLLYRKPVIEVVKIPMRNTILLNILVMIAVFAITIPLGITTAVKKGTVYDNSVQVITILGYSLPTFIIALAAMLLFSVTLGWLPLTGTSTAGLTGTSWQLFLDRLKHMILPTLVLTFSSLGSLTRYIRAAMIDALRMDYIRTARAKGLKEKVVIYSHAFRNSLIPFVTVLVSWMLSLFSGSIMIEKIFVWDGMGKLLVQAITNMDYGLAMAVEMFYVLLSLIGNLIVDIAYTMVDPRVRLS